jgi:hypothetical protein
MTACRGSVEEGTALPQLWADVAALVKKAAEKAN